ncbi:MAG: alpha-ketoacid dehydrogenase subunit beta [Desulfobacterales bacterium]|jgi:pyruvate/2-oxoglutarate/acetoin dehydrogenase E1 component|nr:alpha-ketoacid dehydrogenase subunit beta [Desulfobacterales bacterium]
MAEMMYREALRRALDEEMRRDPLVFLMGETIAERGGSYKVTEGLLKKYGPRRVIDTPIAEASFTGMAVGAALIGCRPVVEILFVDFAMLAMDQIVNQAAKQEFISGGQCRVPMVLRTQGGAGNGLAAQHSQSLEALFYHIPGLKVAMPSTPRDACGLLKAAIRDDQPVIFIEHKLLYMTRGPVPEEEYVIPLGRAEVKKSGTDVSLITYSHMTLKCLEAAAALEADGISVEVVDLRTLAPLDKETILASARKTGRAIVVHEAVKRGGVGGDIAAMLMEEAYDDLDGPVLRIAGRNTPIPYNLNIEKACVPSVEDIVAGVLRMV